MSTLRAFSIRALAGVALTCLGIVLSASPSMAQGNRSNYIFLMASDFLCDSGDPTACPAVVKTDQGESYEMSGAGIFDSQSKLVKVAGTFTHKAPNGNTLDTGVWFADELVAFNSYGVAPSAFMHQETALGREHFGPKRMPMFVGPLPTGGLAIVRIRLLPIRGPSRSAVLQVNSALGDVPHDRSVEGIRLVFETSGGEFLQESSGRVMFLAMLPEETAAGKTPEPAKRPQ